MNVNNVLAADIIDMGRNRLQVNRDHLLRAESQGKVDRKVVIIATVDVIGTVDIHHREGGICGSTGNQPFQSVILHHVLGDIDAVMSLRSCDNTAEIDIGSEESLRYVVTSHVFLERTDIDTAFLDPRHERRNKQFPFFYKTGNIHIVGIRHEAVDDLICLQVFIHVDHAVKITLHQHRRVQCPD